MTNYYISSVGYTALAQWTANTAYSLGQYVRQLATPAFGNERVFKVTTAGTSHLTTEPSWNLNNNGTTTDNTVTWTQVMGQEAQQVAGNWKAPAANILAMALAITIVTEDKYFCSSDHDEVHTSAFNYGSGANFISVNRSTGSIPPVPADYTPGAIIESTGNNTITLTNSRMYMGFTFKSGNSTGTSSINIGDTSSGGFDQEFIDCLFYLRSTGTSSIIGIGAGGPTFPTKCKWYNCKVRFAAAQNIEVSAAQFEWRASPASDTVTFDGSLPTALFKSSGSRGNVHHVSGVNLVGVSSGSIVAHDSSSEKSWYFERCKLNSGIATTLVTSSNSNQVFWDRPYVSFHHCDDDTSNKDWLIYETFQNVGNSPTKALLTASITAAVVGGASDGTRGVSYKLIDGGTTVVCPMRVRFSKFNTSTSALTLTLEVAYVSSGTLLSKDCWLEAEVLDSASTQLTGWYTTRPTSWVLDTTTVLTTSTADWTAGASARANSHAYVVGDIIKLASNTTRMFYCTAAGTSSGSEPVGYTSAIDGGAVTDGGATFRAARRYKLQLSFTPGKAGVITAHLNFHDTANTNPLFVDRKFTLA